MSRNKTAATIVNVALTLAIVGAGWMVLSVGVGQTYEVVTGDTTNQTAETLAAYGGAISFEDRLMTFAAVLTLGVGVGVIGISSSNPKVFNQVLRYYPWLVAIVGLVSFSDIVTDFISGDYDFALYDDAQNAYHLFIIGSVVAGIGNLLNMRN
tara:strand:+ start:2975 stop:3433 length:459 start_codon:yes stop_codon:yes gene_type:complete